ncbi:von Willebrand factor D and EGF domain-containing protein-like [Diprion similis]|uniref:von Willebrand factor D and EGF domain-containing protein-like n=1 Tax=Diprion similis TaxID=362088 RepID=UPI001EF8D08E|nr:von Willebrand factor D and EGF domain-containing protein-like [Diprion similis]
MAVQVNLRIVIVFTVFSTVKSSVQQDSHLLVPRKTGSTKGFYNILQRATYLEKTQRYGEETFLHNGYRDNPKTRSLTKRSKDGDCSADHFTRDSVHKNCLKPCSPDNCINGKCEGLTECKCNDGYIKSQTNSFICHPKCRPCQSGECNESQLCTCDEGYRLSSNQRTCEPICNEKRCNGKVCIYPESCKEDLTKNNVTYGQFCNAKCEFGECVGPNTCKCFDGYRKNEYGQCFVLNCTKKCGYGRCVVPDTCKCEDGYTKNKNGQCTRPTCKPECKFATCTGPNYCKCLPGYEKVFENATTCNPVCKGCGKGTCVGPETCHCDKGFGNPKNNKGSCIACESKCKHGRCSNKRCDCSPDWTGKSCTESLLCVIKNPHNYTHITNAQGDSRGTNYTTNDYQIMTDRPICKPECFDQLKYGSIKLVERPEQMDDLIMIDAPTRFMANEYTEENTLPMATGSGR